ncbi:hypothetical protein [Yoonia sp.]
MNIDNKPLSDVPLLIFFSWRTQHNDREIKEYVANQCNDVGNGGAGNMGN